MQKRTEGPAGESALLAEILDAMPERVSRYRFDDRTVVYCNRAWAAGHGGTPEEVVGCTLDELLSPPEIEGMHSQLAKLSRHHSLLTDPNPRQAPEDPSIWIEWVDRLIPQDDGDEVLSIGRDVTARHEAQLLLERSEHRFRQAMVSAPVGMGIVALDGHLLEVNRAFHRFVGHDEATLRGTTWQDLTHPDDLAEELRLVGRMQRGEITTYSLEKRFLHAAGSVRWGLTTSTLVHDPEGRPLHALVHVVDVTDRRRAQEEAEQGRRLQEIAGAVARLGGWEWDVSTGEVTWSRETVAALGYPPGEEPSFEEFLELHPPDARAQLQEAIDRALRDATSWDLELPITSRDGDHLWARCVGVPAVDGEGRVVRLWGAFQDISERELAERERHWLAEQLTATLDRVDDGFLTLDRDWRISHVSARGAVILGRRVDQLVDGDLWDVLPELGGTEVQTTLERAMDEQAIAELDRYHDPRLRSWFELAAHPSSRGLVVFFRDVTDQVEREATLERAIEVEQRAVERLQQLDQAKNAFLSAVSHELRTPLTVVQGMAISLQRLRGDLGGELRARVEDALVDHAEQLRQLLDDLLDVDRLARGTLEANRVSVDVAALVRAVVAGSEARGRIHLDTPEVLSRTVDPVQVERIVTNLLGNATKYAPSGPVSITLTPSGDDGLRLTVRDHGPGVPEHERERIFEPFHRVEDAHPQPGTGIGLALVADFARLHGGKVWVEDPTDGGARFVVELPGSPTPEPGEATPV